MRIDVNNNVNEKNKYAYAAKSYDLYANNVHFSLHAANLIFSN